MISVKCTYANGSSINTDMNGTLEEAESYYLNNWFNLGIVNDNMQQCVSVELI